jgi:solute carrier family 38 (sodium-coupled neutral amino acid transporter), member 11
VHLIIKSSAFGGMVAFCVIVGDTIPHVLTAVVPNLPNMSVLWLFSDRRFVIVLFILGISYPLSLYRDIAKVCEDLIEQIQKKKTDILQLAKASTLALISMLIIIITVVTQGARVEPELKGDVRGSLFINGGIFQAIGVISFGMFLFQSLFFLLIFAN